MASLTAGSFEQTPATTQLTQGSPATNSAPDGLPAEDGAPANLDIVKDDVRKHVVHNGDTLERLAKRYLGNESRALEIFDLNRDVLTNPHLLPIGAELRLPGAAENEE